MSVAASARTAYEVKVVEAVPELKPAAGEPDAESGLEKVTKWTPTEVIAIYVAYLGIFQPSSSTARWVGFAIGALAVLVFVPLSVALADKRGAEQWEEDRREGDPPKTGRTTLGLLILVAAVAYIIWSMALPDSPFLALWDNMTRVGGFLVIPFAGLIAYVAPLLNLEVPKAKN